MVLLEQELAFVSDNEDCDALSAAHEILYFDNEHRILESQLAVDTLLRDLYSLINEDGDTPRQFIEYAKNRFER